MDTGYYQEDLPRAMTDRKYKENVMLACLDNDDDDDDI